MLPDRHTPRIARVADSERGGFGYRARFVSEAARMRDRIFESALNDVRYVFGRPLRLRDGIHAIKDNNWAAAVHEFNRRTGKA